MSLRRQRDVDWDHAVLSVSCSIVNLAGQPSREIPTKNVQTRPVAVDSTTLSMLQAQVDMLTARAAAASRALGADAYGQDLGFSPAAVAMRAGHDPSVASKHYTGKIAAGNPGPGLRCGVPPRHTHNGPEFIAHW